MAISTLCNGSFAKILLGDRRHPGTHALLNSAIRSPSIKATCKDWMGTASEHTEDVHALGQ